jgi:hypothetical protein
MIGQLRGALCQRGHGQPQRISHRVRPPEHVEVEVFFGEGALAFDVSRPGEFAIATGGLPGDSNGFRRVIVGIDHPYVACGLAMAATGIGFGHNDGFVYQTWAFLDEIAGLDELPRNASFADGLHNLQVEEAVVRAAQEGTVTPAACPVPDAKAGLAKPRLMAVSRVATGRRWRC